MHSTEKDKDEFLKLLMEALQNELDDIFLESLDSSLWKDEDEYEDELEDSSTDQLDFDIL